MDDSLLAAAVPKARPNDTPTAVSCCQSMARRLGLAALADSPALASLITHDFGAAPIIVFALGSFSINLHAIVTVCWHKGFVHIFNGMLDLKIAVAWRAL